MHLVFVNSILRAQILDLVVLYDEWMDAILNNDQNLCESLHEKFERQIDFLAQHAVENDVQITAPESNNLYH